LGFGISIFLLAAGSVLAFAVGNGVQGTNVVLVGVILLIVGGIGLLVSLVATTQRTTEERHIVEHDSDEHPARGRRR
jgi:hypothetical protein